MKGVFVDCSGLSSGGRDVEEDTCMGTNTLFLIAYEVLAPFTCLLIRTDTEDSDAQVLLFR